MLRSRAEAIKATALQALAESAERNAAAIAEIREMLASPSNFDSAAVAALQAEMAEIRKIMALPVQLAEIPSLKDEVAEFRALVAAPLKVAEMQALRSEVNAVRASLIKVEDQFKRLNDKGS